MKPNQTFARAIGLTMLSALMVPSVNAQIQVTDVYVATGLHRQTDRPLSLDDFRVLAPQSVLLNQDLSEYEEGGGWGFGGRATFSMSVGIRLHDKPNPQLRFGVSYLSGLDLSTYLSKTDRWAYDTLTSSQTGEVYYLDSVVDRSYYMNYTSDQLRLDLSMIWRTNPEARWSLFAGVGIAAGMSINATTDISYRISRYTGFEDNPHYFPDNEDSQVESETFTNKSSLGFSAMLPMGVDLRVGNKIEFLRRLHLFYEMRPGLNVLNIPELRSFKSVGVQQLYGLRVSVG